MKPGARVAWLSSAQAAAHLGFRTLKSFHRWLERQPADSPRRHYLGRRLRFRQVDLDVCVESDPQAVDAVTPLRLVSKGGR